MWHHVYVSINETGYGFLMVDGLVRNELILGIHLILFFNVSSDHGYR